MPPGDGSFGVLFLFLRLGGATGSAAWLLIVAVFFLILILIFIVVLIDVVWVLHFNSLLRRGKSIRQPRVNSPS